MLVIETLGELPHRYFLGERLPPVDLPQGLLDLFDALVSIYFHDILTPEHEREEITVQVPISDLEVWATYHEELESIVNFMIPEPEHWELVPVRVEEKTISGQASLLRTEFSHVSPLSGGLDSFCGTAVSDGTPFLVTFRSNNFELSRAKQVGADLEKAGLRITLEKFGPPAEIRKVHLKQRTRSLMFLGLSLVCARALGIDEVRLYENGILSLNPSYSRETTKTTHPRVISGLNRILSHLGEAVVVSHPFVFRTKGEMLAELGERFHPIIATTYTCSKNRQAPTFDASDGKHCGACIPCVLRKISINRANLQEFDAEYNDVEDPEHALHKEFLSSRRYFRRVASDAQAGRIMSELDVGRRNYPGHDDYFEETRRMFHRFSQEVFDLFGQ